MVPSNAPHMHDHAIRASCAVCFFQALGDVAGFHDFIDHNRSGVELATRDVQAFLVE
jgi:hypothetical protein